MSTTNCQKFKGESQNFLSNGINNIESKSDAAFFDSIKIWTYNPNKGNIHVGFRAHLNGYHSAAILVGLRVGT